MAERLIVRGAREHNLKGVDIDIPRDKMVVFTGLSGSGKSSLAFDTIFAEGQRRYVESLSSYARMFLGQMDKPNVEYIGGLSPAVSIDQKSTNHNPRSTVGTITEIYDYLRLLFSRAGTPHCPKCDAVIERQTPQQIVDAVLEQEEKLKFQVLAPVVRKRKGEFVDLFQDLSAQGYSRVRVDGETHQLSNPPKLKKQVKHTIEVVVDRLQVKASQKQRLTDSVETALRLADGLVTIEFVDKEELTHTYSEKAACPKGHALTIEEYEPRAFSFNAPFGSCPACDGLGTKLEVDVDLLIPDPDAPAVDAVQPWHSSPNSRYFAKLVEGLGKALGFEPQTPVSKLTKEQREALIYGTETEVRVRYKNRYGRQRNWTAPFEGAVGFLHRKLDTTDSQSQKDRLLQYTRPVPCRTCKGTRLKPEILAVRLASASHGEQSIAGLSALSIEDASEFLDTLCLGHREEIIAGAVLKETQARLRFLLDVGLNYLTLDRGASTLSGGEAQRIRLATQIGSGLAGVLYVLDEPSIGLHQRDNHRLISTLQRLRDIGNTLIVVEHDEDTIRSSDWLVDVGPRAGEYGGEVVYQGEPAGVENVKDSLTGQYLSGSKVLAVPDRRREIDKDRTLKVVGARENNLKGINVEIPLGVLVCITGVSGSGKSTVVNEILAKTLANNLNRARQVPGRAKRVEGIEHLDKLVQVDQSPIGRTPRSNPATYTGVFDKIRNLFAETQEAKVRGYKAGRFSFNVKGGRCDACQGDGTIKIEMNFLPDVYVPCEVCEGARYNRETLEVHYKGKNISEVLDMPISEAAEFFEPITSIHRYLATLVDVGLGYVRLGQAATTLSGGEAQRVKLASELQKRTNGRTIYILDEPTTGLHFEDIRRLMLVIQGLVDKGNSVLIIEHNLDVIKAADWIVDMGPEGGAGGGTVVAQGTPEKVAQTEGSYTGVYLKEILS
ncbi:excinuclease ABC subunit UvrA [Corynebacterium macginleyi]|uniref:UvrABC system protein A n=1 Tax=Corynebacterium macginleyi TaxID=38290 RepID=A0A3M0GUB1_9CORY|nr:excinuclease ABC subunit UvrA [Corynebacterium macginleyi]MBK4150768.1 excinuclease ABC subunit UvrA [Corynebacterium macginleyi]MBK4156631.1 excinuclease ABC subunit UvrA [Corynebacterium macginleyi]MBK4160546.1 excinuclease ABC subunit UvrA [Corynebacterium macginleyi]MBK4162779.1 excinuclease ABC subunit UvrA [Corynebacterium macginleyi]MBK4164847.1 excinuclease ABC subunit UvrA [Corynebacterium macginleyi]